jgi:hypothetical protein
VEFPGCDERARWHDRPEKVRTLMGSEAKYDHAYYKPAQQKDLEPAFIRIRSRPSENSPKAQVSKQAPRSRPTEIIKGRLPKERARKMFV